ncbi:hypothetical protein LIA77_06604 [Sarocladium implicatum]|nr:hypothetical protein LIA77_06604 [Sarocladium implicatum]
MNRSRRTREEEGTEAEKKDWAAVRNETFHLANTEGGEGHGQSRRAGCCGRIHAVLSYMRFCRCVIDLGWPHIGDPDDRCVMRRRMNGQSTIDAREDTSSSGTGGGLELAGVIELSRGNTSRLPEWVDLGVRQAAVGGDRGGAWGPSGSGSRRAIVCRSASVPKEHACRFWCAG